MLHNIDRSCYSNLNLFYILQPYYLENRCQDTWSLGRGFKIADTFGGWSVTDAFAIPDNVRNNSAHLHT